MSRNSIRSHRQSATPEYFAIEIKWSGHAQSTPVYTQLNSPSSCDEAELPW